MDFVTKMQNVKGKVVKVECNKNGYYSYLFAVTAPTADETQYLYKSKNGYLIWLKDKKEQQLQEKQEVTIADLGIEQYNKNDGTVGYAGHIIVEKPSIKKMFEKEVNTPPPAQSSNLPTKEPQIKPLSNQPTEKVDWDGKEKREYRGKCLMYAQSCFPPVTSETTNPPTDRADELIWLADLKFMDYIYNGVSKNDQPF